jgi:hypothetical protein
MNATFGGQGPFLNVAVVCAKVLCEQDGTMSVIRIFDRVALNMPEPATPGAGDPVRLPVTIAVTLKAGAAQGRHTVTFELEDPIGRRAHVGKLPVHFERNDHGANLTLDVPMSVERSGLHWIHVKMGDHLLTRMPLHISRGEEDASAGALPTGGPFVQLAALCQLVLQEKEGFLSLIRVIDRITGSTEDPQAPDVMPPFSFNASMVLFLKSGELTGQHTATVEHESPSGGKVVCATLPLEFEGGDRGPQVILGVQSQIDVEGVHWFHIRLDDRPLTRIPLRILYQPIDRGGY